MESHDVAMTEGTASPEAAALALADIAKALCSIEVCSECSMQLDLAAPTTITPANAWLCGGCGSVYFARRLESAESSPLKGIRPVHYDQVFSAADLHADSTWRRAPYQDLRRVLQFLSSFEHPGSEQRRQRRHPVALPVLALPLGHNYRVIGEAIEMTMINLSRAGAALLDSQPSRAPYLAVDFAVSGLNTVQAILEVLRVRPLVSAFETAGRWRCRILPWTPKTKAR